MRIPTSKIYRAFPELDRFTDYQCQLLMRRVRLQLGATLGWTALIVGAYFALMIVVGMALGFLAAILGESADVPIKYEQFVTLLILLVLIGLPALGCVYLRDAILRYRLSRSIDYEINRIRCLHCKYILIGQVPSGGYVGCPECGASFKLGELGLTEDDLLPPPQGAGV